MTIITNMTWQQFDDACKQIAQRVPKTITKIYGISRGGLIPAVRLSHLLRIPFADVIDKHTLVIDDISDTGKTLGMFRCVAGMTATLVCNVKFTSFIPDIWVYEKGNVWCIFPWEQKEK